MTRRREDESMDDLPWAPAVMPRPELSESICRHCTGGLGKRRPRLPAAGRAIGILLVSGAVVAAVGVGSGVAASHAWVAWVALSLLAYFGLAANPSRVWRRSSRVVLAVVVPAAFFAFLAGTAHRSAGAGFAAHGEELGSVVRCMAATLGASAILTGCVFFRWLHTDAFTPRLSGLMAGLTGGLMGGVLASVACAHAGLAHAVLSHGIGIVALSLAGTVAGRRLMAP